MPYSTWSRWHTEERGKKQNQSSFPFSEYITFFKAWINQPGVLTFQNGGGSATCSLVFVSHSTREPLLSGHISHSFVFPGRTNCQPFTAGMGIGLEEWLLVLFSPGIPLAFPVIISYCSYYFPFRELLQSPWPGLGAAWQLHGGAERRSKAAHPELAFQECLESVLVHGTLSFLDLFQVRLFPTADRSKKAWLILI